MCDDGQTDGHCLRFELSIKSRNRHRILVPKYIIYDCLSIPFDTYWQNTNVNVLAQALSYFSTILR